MPAPSRLRASEVSRWWGGDDDDLHVLVRTELGDAGVRPEAGELLFRRLSPGRVGVAGRDHLETGRRVGSQAVVKAHSAVGPVPEHREADRPITVGQLESRHERSPEKGRERVMGQSRAVVAEAGDDDPAVPEPPLQHDGPIPEPDAHLEDRDGVTACGLEAGETVDDRELPRYPLGEPAALAEGDLGKPLSGRLLVDHTHTEPVEQRGARRSGGGMCDRPGDREHGGTTFDRRVQVRQPLRRSAGPGLAVHHDGAEGPRVG